MNEKEILEYNKRCALFLGYTIKPKNEWYIYEQAWLPHGKTHYPISELKFHSDWNWIMDVVEAIEKVADWSLECLNDSDGDRDYQMMIPLSDTNVVLKDKKEAVVDAINQFLIWWEQNKILVLSLYQNDPTRNT